MKTVNSADGTQITYDRYGDGPALILVTGALSYRRFKKFEQIATALSEQCTRDQLRPPWAWATVARRGRCPSSARSMTSPR